MSTLRLIHDLCVIWMTAIIWAVQLVIYPSFRFVEENEFLVFHRKYTNLIIPLVAPMLIQFGVAWFLIMATDRSVNDWVQAISVSVIFASTYFFSMPEHTTLAQGKNLGSINRLIKTNWIRTLLWSGQSISVLYASICKFKM